MGPSTARPWLSRRAAMALPVSVRIQNVGALALIAAVGIAVGDDK